MIAHGNRHYRRQYDNRRTYINAHLRKNPLALKIVPGG
jgi:hypothetical protein